MNRVVIITECEDSLSEGAKLEFDSTEMRDSHALHLLLCEYSPGDNYTIEFKNL